MSQDNAPPPIRALVEALIPLDDLERARRGPAATVRRECLEELDIEAHLHTMLEPGPLFITVTETNGSDPHRDVNLWHVLEASQSSPLRADPCEYRSVLQFSGRALR